MSEKAVGDVANTLGALLVGSFAAAALTGITTVQIFLYFKLYPSDKIGLKIFAFVIWFLDLTHTVLIGRTVWRGLIVHFGAMDRAQALPWPLALTIVDTAVLTIIVHCFFIYRIHILTNHNYLISMPLSLLALSRLVFACLATYQMITLKLLHAFVRRYRWTFTGDLLISAVMDVIITISLCYLLRRSQKSLPSSLGLVLDSLILYTFETGALTCIATLTVLIYWLAIPTNLVFMSLYFVIIKLYANSLLATLNTRRDLQKVNTSHGTQVEAGTRQNHQMTEISMYARDSETQCSGVGSFRKRSSSETQV
ncbi:hypothetical protein AX14_012524 [Amanita brunnescens Koide BX004]|nr:hypothetical protein AX14_012524 [Amanita brunnescens Koide BX004]